jgi:eukaryotic-like serine/threonine-protein kinase
MPTLTGGRLGVYEVLELIGIGGMGEVYRARDVRLNRDVALKILPTLFADDPARLARFEREARVLASLNHSNIGAIHGFEESDGVHALVLELVDGPTLADRIAEGRIPLDDALPVAMQIAEALEAAHERGIVHRDLKPANIKVRHDGTVKVLDFGLAKALVDDVAPTSVSQSPTITSPALTRMGMILGTAAYMSPEQACGKAADKRSDIWGFGCVLYEMLTGKRAFEGSEVSDTLASILKSDPDWSPLPAETPSGVRRVLRRCLEKDPRRRFHDIADARLDLEERTASDATAPVATPASKLPARERATWALVTVALASLAAVLAYVTLKTPPAQELTRFHVYPPADTSLGSVSGPGGIIGASSGTVSPDGTHLVFVATDRGGKTMLWVRPLDSFSAQPLTGSDGAAMPFWSPDGRSLGFFVGAKLKRIDGTSGSPQTLSDLPGNVPKGGTWGAGGDILFSAGNSPKLYRVSARGGTATAVAVRGGASNSTEIFWPYFLPDGRHFLYWARSPSRGPGVYVASIDPSATATRLVGSDSQAVYSPAGFLLFARQGTLLRQPFDPNRLTVTGEPTPVAEQITQNVAVGLAAFSVSATGVLTFQTAANLSTQFAWFDRTGRLLETVGPPGRYRMPTLSPDGTRLAYMDVEAGDIWLLDMVRQTPTRFTSNPAIEASPVWSLDGRKIFYRSTQDGGSIFEKDASGAIAEQLFFKGAVNGPSQVSPDGKLLLYFANPGGESVQDVFVLPMTGDRKPQRIVETQFADVEPQFSPDGKLLAYASSETGRYEVYVQPFPRTGARWKISNSGGRQPLWRADGKELFFVSDDRKFYTADIQTVPAFDFSAPHFLFEMRANVFNARNSYWPSRDGQRFLVNMALDTAGSPISVVRNWAVELNK